MAGIFYGVGVGPGDPELITLKAKRIIGSCAVIAAPRTPGGNMQALSIVSQVMDLSGKKVLPLLFPMRQDEKERKESYGKAAADIITCLESGDDVAMLNIGDVSLYSTFSYLAREIRASGYETVMCAGVPSFCAAAAELGATLADGSEPLVVIPAQSPETESLLGIGGTKVIMKSGGKFSEIRDMIGRSGSLSVSAAENCGMPDQKLYRGLDEMTDCGYLTVIIVR